MKLETREVLAAAYLGPNKGRTMLSHSVEIGSSGSVIRVLCGRVSPLSIADHFAQDTTLDPTLQDLSIKEEEVAARRIRAGSWVRLKQRVRSGRQKARVEREVPSLAPGAVLLDDPIDGFRWWNKVDLQATNRPRRAACLSLR